MNILRIVSSLLFIVAAALIYFSEWPRDLRMILVVFFGVMAVTNIALIFLMKKLSDMLRK
ncbi:hypothetical protein ACP3TJ_01645 [Desulforudis sp. 1088]|uniref:hypothetical protein n=1 Tax=unclassified Candidatus Desulforudis TaxID=2635950 RepID=UPI0034942EC0